MAMTVFSTGRTKTAWITGQFSLALVAELLLQTEQRNGSSQGHLHTET